MPGKIFRKNSDSPQIERKPPLNLLVAPVFSWMPKMIRAHDFTKVSDFVFVEISR
jgi:hypothetical protein